MTFSIIIPCYDVEAYLRETLDSVIEQTFTDWECICVDDGSTDGTAAILDQYAEEDTRFCVIHKANEGVSAARNDAIRLAHGEYVCFLDGDDVWDPEWLERVYEASQNGCADIVRMAFTFWHGERIGTPVPTFDRTASIQFIKGADAVLHWGWKIYTTDGYIWLNTVRRKILIENKLSFPLGMKINEDIIFDLSLLPYATCVALSSFAGYFYRMRSTSAWHSNRPIDGCTRYLEESIRLWENSREQLERLSCVGQLRRNEAYMFYSAVLQWFDFGLKEERCRANEIARLLKRAAQLSMMDLGAIPICWRPAFLFAQNVGSFLLARMTYFALDGYHRVHKKMIQRKNCCA